MDSAEPIIAAPLSRREAGKAQRRQQIIRAARDLIRETGNAGLSMRGLAARAGVSLATPYNLFGSKRAIVVAVLQDVREYQERFASLPASDPVDRIFKALDLALEFYNGDREFYRTLWTAVFDASDGVRGEILNPERDAFWRRLILDAVHGGAISPEYDADLILQQLETLLRSLMFAWAIGEISPERLSLIARHGYALILHGAASADWRGPLRSRILACQEALRR